MKPRIFCTRLGDHGRTGLEDGRGFTGFSIFIFGGIWGCAFMGGEVGMG